MTATRQDVFRLLGFIADDLRKTQAQLTEVRSMIASMPMPEERAEFHCMVCRTNVGGERALAFHMQNVHAGPPVPLSDAEAVG